MISAPMSGSVQQHTTPVRMKPGFAPRQTLHWWHNGHTNVANYWMLIHSRLAFWSVLQSPSARCLVDTKDIQELVIVHWNCSSAI